MKVRILDLDNTIANDGWRIPFIDWKVEHKFDRYHKYHSLAAFDQPGNLDLFQGALSQGVRIAVLTARPEFYRHATEEWLGRQGLGGSIVLMRPEFDHCSSSVLKERQLLWLWRDHGVELYDIECCYDDRPDVVAMYRKMGLQAEVRFIHELCAYTQPKQEENA